jgi:hypothetical protein
MENEQRSESPATVRQSTKVERVRAFIRQNGRLTIRMFADDLNECTVHQTVTRFELENSVCKNGCKQFE